LKINPADKKTYKHTFSEKGAAFSYNEDDCLDTNTKAFPDFAGQDRRVCFQSEELIRNALSSLYYVPAQVNKNMNGDSF